MKYVVAVGNGVDRRAGEYLGDCLQCPVIDASLPFDYSTVQKPIGVGGTPASGWSSYIHTVIQGSDRFDTLQRVLNFINSGNY